ncbi:MAG: anaerobic ribonucleoside-triphosphate reductase activating protein [Tannerella sp.]|jgi:anaerobic ribonucleoside-triphosphate reductase activating protein|nr:anaerobic ribonucleoside-triphosphate reductase activating protein [Tannerella sp.]
MLRYASYDIVFQEIPGEVTLALNISGCPNRCAGCHSPHLQDDIGETLNENMLVKLLDAYGASITCICFMGGDAEPPEVLKLAGFARNCGIKAAWYSGRSGLFEDAEKYFDYIKLGAYIENLGGLDSPVTNQHLYRIDNGQMTDITKCFHQNIKSTKYINT